MKMLSYQEASFYAPQWLATMGFAILTRCHLYTEISWKNVNVVSVLVILFLLHTGGWSVLQFEKLTLKMLQGLWRSCKLSPKMSCCDQNIIRICYIQIKLEENFFLQMAEYKYVSEHIQAQWWLSLGHVHIQYSTPAPKVLTQNIYKSHNLFKKSITFQTNSMACIN